MRLSADVCCAERAVGEGLGSEEECGPAGCFIGVAPLAWGGEGPECGGEGRGGIGWQGVGRGNVKVSSVCGRSAESVYFM